MKLKYATVFALLLSSLTASAYQAYEAGSLTIGMETTTNDRDEAGENLISLAYKNNDPELLPTFEIKVTEDGELKYQKYGLASIDSELIPLYKNELEDTSEIFTYTKDKTIEGITKTKYTVVDVEEGLYLNRGSVKVGLNLGAGLGYEIIDIDGLKDDLRDPYVKYKAGLMLAYDNEGKYRILGRVNASQKRHIDNQYEENNQEVNLGVLVDRISRKINAPIYFYVKKNLRDDAKYEDDFGDDVRRELQDDYKAGFQIPF